MIMIEKRETFELQRKARPFTQTPYPHHDADHESIEFRLQMLGTAIARLPARILVDEKNGCYSVRDNTLMVVWADDLPDGGGEELIYEMAMLFNIEDQDKFLNAVNPKTQGTSHSVGLDLKGGFISHDGVLRRKSVPVTVCVQYGADSGGKIYELRIEPMYR